MLDIALDHRRVQRGQGTTDHRPAHLALPARLNRRWYARPAQHDPVMGGCVRHAWQARERVKVGSVPPLPKLTADLCAFRYCLSHSPVPIIVVRPEEKVRKTMAKRRADPKRGSHFEKCVP